MEYTISKNNRNNSYNNNRERKAFVLRKQAKGKKRKGNRFGEGVSNPLGRKADRHALGWAAVDEADRLVCLMEKSGLPTEGVHAAYYKAAKAALYGGKPLPPFAPWLGYEPLESEWGFMSAGVRRHEHKTPEGVDWYPKGHPHNSREWELEQKKKRGIKESDYCYEW